MSTKPVETILDKLQNVEAHGNYYTALCPGHDDQRRSLSISEGDDGRALVKCHAGCDTSNVLAAMGLKMGDLFPKGDGRGEIEATYDYHDGGGKLLYQVVRFKPKNFVCRRPNGAGGWLWNLDGTERVLYHLPELLKESGRVVFVAEGEKSVDAVRGLGLLATCNPHGAGKWNGAYSEPLRGRPVVILPDNDDPGRNHAQDVAKDLLAKAASVRVLELPDLADKQDVVDWISRGGDRDTLTRLANGAPLAAVWLEAQAMANKTRAVDDDVHLTDMGNATRLAALHGDNLRYIHPWHKWLAWDGQRWAVDNVAWVTMLAKDAVREMYLEASQVDDDKERERLVRHALRSESKERIKAMLELCQSEPGIPILPEHLDHDPWLLNCLNGTVDLRTGELLAHDKEDLITKLCPAKYDPNAQHDLWTRFLDDTTGGDQELQRFLQVSIGYSLTGITSEEKLFFVHGPTATGKSTFIEAIKATLGDYAMTADFETFLSRRVTGGPRTDIARLAGARFVASVEVDEGKRLAEGLVKTLTGGDTVTTRFLYSGEFEFIPTFKLWMAANHAPKVRDDDDATWRRILRAPFTHAVPKDKIDPTVKAILKNPNVVGPAILAWAVKGCLLWQRDGLSIPNVINKATSDLRDEMNPLADFFTICCVFGPQCWTSAQALRLAYETHAQENGERYLVRGREWGKRLKDMGCVQGRQTVGDKQVRGWSGIGLLDSKDGLDGLDGNFPKSAAGTEHIGESCQMPSNASNLSSDPVIEAAQALGGEVVSVRTVDGTVRVPF